MQLVVLGAFLALISLACRAPHGSGPAEFRLVRAGGRTVPTLVAHPEYPRSPAAMVGLLAGSLELTSPDSLRFVLRLREPDPCPSLPRSGGVTLDVPDTSGLLDALAPLLLCDDAAARTVERRLAWSRVSDSITVWLAMEREAGADTTYVMRGALSGNTLRLPFVLGEWSDEGGATRPQVIELEFVRPESRLR